MLFGEEPRKQKTCRPERRGITRAVSPKKIGKRKKGMSKLRSVGERETRRAYRPQSLPCWKAPMMGARAPFLAITSGLPRIRSECAWRERHF